jgi:hypothetical protein
MRKLHAILFVALSSVMSGPVYASAIFCDAVPYARLGVDAGGNILVDFTGAGIVNVCNTSVQERGISKEGCVAWYSGLLTHRASKTKVRFYFDNANPQNSGLTSCSQLGDWTTRAPYFMESY